MFHNPGSGVPGAGFSPILLWLERWLFSYDGVFLAEEPESQQAKGRDPTKETKNGRKGRFGRHAEEKGDGSDQEDQDRRVEQGTITHCVLLK